MDDFGRLIIEHINKTFKVTIEVTEESAESMSNLINDIVTENGYGYCDGCDKRQSAEPVYRYNEGYE